MSRASKLAELTQEQRDRAAKIILEAVPEGVQKLIRIAYSVNPESWYAPYHFSWGMALRNHLREKGFTDKEVPDRNLDDYYVALVEYALGLRK